MQGGRAGRCQAERSRDCEGLTSAVFWTSHFDFLQPGWKGRAKAAGKRPKQQADVAAGSSPPSAAP